MSGMYNRFFGMLLREPITTRATSATNQWAGRTTLNSGSATITVSSAIVKSDSVIMGFLEGNVNYGILHQNITVNSGDVTTTLSNAAIAADSLVTLTMHAGGTNQTSGVSNAMEVKSLGAGSIDIGWADGNATRAGATEVTALITPKDGFPMGIEVKTISDGDFFTLGRVDNRAISRDTIVMWMMLRTN